MNTLRKLVLGAAALVGLSFGAAHTAHAYTKDYYTFYPSYATCHADEIAFSSSWTRIYQRCRYDSFWKWYFVVITVGVAPDPQPDDPTESLGEPDDSSDGPSQGLPTSQTPAVPSAVLVK